MNTFLRLLSLFALTSMQIDDTSAGDEAVLRQAKAVLRTRLNDHKLAVRSASAALVESLRDAVAKAMNEGRAEDAETIRRALNDFEANRTRFPDLPKSVIGDAISDYRKARRESLAKAEEAYKAAIQIVDKYPLKVYEREELYVGYGDLVYREHLETGAPAILEPEDVAQMNAHFESVSRTSRGRIGHEANVPLPDKPVTFYFPVTSIKPCDRHDSCYVLTLDHPQGIGSHGTIVFSLKTCHHRIPVSPDRRTKYHYEVSGQGIWHSNVSFGRPAGGLAVARIASSLDPYYILSIEEPTTRLVVLPISR